jgi:peptide/nickel transport system ATP-binding protein
MRAARSKALAPHWPTFAPPQWPNFTPPLTSALDALVQKKIARQMDDLRHRTQTAYVVVTHDLGFAAVYADQILVLRGGAVEAHQPRADFFANPQSAYAAELIQAAHSLGALEFAEQAA